MGRCDFKGLRQKWCLRGQDAQGLRRQLTGAVDEVVSSSGNSSSRANQRYVEPFMGGLPTVPGRAVVALVRLHCSLSRGRGGLCGWFNNFECCCSPEFSVPEVHKHSSVHKTCQQRDYENTSAPSFSSFSSTCLDLWRLHPDPEPSREVLGKFLHSSTMMLSTITSK